MENNNEAVSRSFMSKEDILGALKERGLRITGPRRLIVDIITEEEFSCCKEVYFLAHKRDSSIGIATVYRMINVLEEIGALSRKNIQVNACTGRCCDMSAGCTVVTGESSRIDLSQEDMQEAIAYIMKKKGYTDPAQIKAVLVNEET